MSVKCPHCGNSLGEAILPDPIGRKVKLNRDDKDDDYFLAKGTEGVICAVLDDDWFLVNFNGMNIGEPAIYLDPC